MLWTHAISSSGEDTYNNLNNVLQKITNVVQVLPTFLQESIFKLTHLDMSPLSNIVLPTHVRQNTSVKKVVFGSWVNPNTIHTSSKTFIFYIHGGAYEIGSPGVYMPFLRHLSYRTQCAVYGAKYVTTFNKNIQQIHENLEMAFWEASTEGKTPIFMGDSAGGGLVLTFFQHMRKKHVEVKLSLKSVLISPWVDLDFFDEENLPYDTSKKHHDYLPLALVQAFAKRIFPHHEGIASAKNSVMDLENTWEKTFVVVGQDEVLGQSIRETFAGKENFLVKTYPKMKHIFTVLASFTNRVAFNSLCDIAKFILDDMVHISCKIISYRGKTSQYGELRCACSMNNCSEHRIYQKHDMIENAHYFWSSCNGLFHWMHPRENFINNLKMDVCFMNGNELIYENTFNISNSTMLEDEDIRFEIVFS